MAQGLPKENDPEGFELETKAPPVGFTGVHPIPGAQKGLKGKDTVPWGGSDGDESQYFRCKQCGFINNRKRNTPGSGWGNETLLPYIVVTPGNQTYLDPSVDYSSGTVNYNGNNYFVKWDIVNAGCAFCGASEMEK